MGGSLDINLKITAPDGSLLHQTHREAEGKINFQANTLGSYKMCFSNIDTSQETKTITYATHVGDLMDKNLDKKDREDPIEKSILRLTEGLEQIQQEQRYLKVRESVHRDLVEITYERLVYVNIYLIILKWSVAQLIFLVAMSLWQLYYLKSIFEKKTNL
jgi:p24 family protein beta-1